MLRADSEEVGLKRIFGTFETCIPTRDTPELVRFHPSLPERLKTRTHPKYQNHPIILMKIFRITIVQITNIFSHQMYFYAIVRKEGKFLLY